jgi:hypothetical protein
MNRPFLKSFLFVIGIPVLYAAGLRIFFGIDNWEDLYSVMSISFLFLLPLIMGALAVYFSSEQMARSAAYRFFIPWVPVLLFFFITIATGLEGLGCWVMILPIFLLFASIGGSIGGYFKLRKKNDDKTYISAFLLLPLLTSPVEQMVGAIPGTYQAYTSIDIQAPADRIWDNVTRVKEIPASQDKGWLTRSLGFPRPVKAELNFLGVGAHREAIFTNGLVFHETVTEYTDQKKMVFRIKAYPHEIPSVTMDEHVVIGGAFFDVLNGTYELEKLDEKTYRLHLYSHFKLTTTFNFYASWWARWIMQDIQNNILKVEKQRAEEEPTGPHKR